LTGTFGVRLFVEVKKSMENKRLDIVGIIPAAGCASRISPIPCSKEIYPIGIQKAGGKRKIKVASSDLVESFSLAGAHQVYMIIRKGKWDIPQYLGLGEPANTLAYIVTDPTEGTHQTIDLAYPFVKDKLVLLGFPDILFKPRNAHELLIEKQTQTDADVVLGLFKTDNHKKADMVEIDEQGRLRDIVIKPEETTLTDTWAVAVWTPAFTEYLHDFVGNKMKSGSKSLNREIFIGDVILQAHKEGMLVETVSFLDGKFIDIGTLPELERVLSNKF
jgi:glucose-1-phosphate thymidylyltransferase